MDRYDRTPDDPRGWTNVLAEVPLFAGLGPRHLRKVASAARIRRFADGTVIMRAGDVGENLYVLLDGEVSIRRRDRPPLALGMGSFVGELALLDGEARSATVVARGPVVSLVISRPRFLKLLKAEPSIAIGVAQELARRLRATQAFG